MPDDSASERKQLTAEALARAADAAPAERAALLHEVVRLNLAVARDVTRRFRGRGVPTEDLEQVAYLGLVLAARRFDPTKAADFLSFAVPTIRGELRRHFRDQGWMVRPPRSIQELQPRMQSAHAELTQELGRKPSSGEVAERLGVPVRQVEDALAAQGAFFPASTDAVGPDDAPVADRLASEESGYAEVEDRATVRALTRGLSRQDRQLLELRFWRGCSQEEIGREVGVTQSQVSRQLGVVLQRLRAVDTP